MNKKELKQENIRLGTHGEDYGSWMSNPVFYIIGGITALAVVLAVLSFSVFHITVLGVLFSVVAAALVALRSRAGSAGTPWRVSRRPSLRSPARRTSRD